MIRSYRPSPARRRHRVWTAALAAVAAIGGFAGVATNSAVAATPKALPASAVPWSSVGSGWTLAAWAATSKSTETVYLISPANARYAITTAIAGTTLIDWTTEGTPRVLVANTVGTYQVDMKTAARRKITGLGESEIFGYADPGANALIGTAFGAGETGKDNIVRWGLDGKRQVTYPRYGTDEGRVQTAIAPVQVSSNGTFVAGAERGLILYHADSYYTARNLIHKAKSCLPSSLLRPGVLVVQCNGVLDAVNVDGSGATKLTDGASQGNPFGYSDLWTISGGRLGLSPNGCGPATLVRFDSAGHGTRIYPAPPVSGTGGTDYVAHSGNVVFALFHHGECEGSANTLFSWNAATHHSTALLGPGVNGGSVISVAPWTADRIGN